MTDSKPRSRTELNDIMRIQNRMISNEGRKYGFISIELKADMPVSWRTCGMDLFELQNLCREHVVRLEIAGTPYRLFPVVHISKLKRVRRLPDRPKMRLDVGESERFDFDETMLPEDSWKHSFVSDEFEVEKIMNVRSGRKTRYGRIHREFLIRWKGYSDPSWIYEMDLNC